MSLTATDQNETPLNEYQQRVLKNNADKFHPILNQSGTFRTCDLSGDSPQNHYGAMQLLKQTGAIEIVGRDRGGNGGTRVCTYQWNRPHKDYLESYLEDRNELPCGHRAHIFNDPEVGLSCKFCDGQPEYDEQTVKKALSG